MRRARLVLAPSELEHLDVLIGSHWDHYGGGSMLDHGTYALLSMFVETSGGTITLSVDQVPLDIEDEGQEYSILRIRSGAVGIRNAARKGDLFFHHRGQRINGIQVVRDTVRGYWRGDPDFELVADSGIVFVLEDGCVGVCIGGSMAPDLFIACAPEPDSLRLYDGSVQWASDLDSQYEFERHLIPVSQLVLEP